MTFRSKAKPLASSYAGRYCTGWARKNLFVACLNEFGRVLKKEARIVFTMPTERHFLRFHAREIGDSRYEVTATSRQGCTLYAPYVETVKALCEAAKLRIDRVMFIRVWG